MAKSEKTVPKVARQTGKVLPDGRTSKAKSSVGSGLPQNLAKKPPLVRAGKAAGKAGPKSSSKRAKSSAGGALAQRASISFPVKSFAVMGSSLSKAERSAAVRTVAKKK